MVRLLLKGLYLLKYKAELVFSSALDNLIRIYNHGVGGGVSIFIEN